MAAPHTLFKAMFNAAVSAADPAHVIGDFLPSKPKGRTIIIGAGKASAQMAAAFEAVWDGPLEGIVVTRYGYGAPCKRIKVLEAAHPVPDEAGLVAAQQLFTAVDNLTADDLVVALISGGGSALLPSPPPGMSLADEIAINEALLASGAPIAAMNMLRKHFSLIKGGRLALAAFPAKVVTLIVSDIPGDNPAFVASGPTVADQAGRAEALDIVDAYQLQLPLSAMRHLQSAAADAPSPDDPRFANHEVHIIASAARSLEAAAQEAGRHDYNSIILSDAMEGEARDVGSVHAAIAREIATRNRPFEKPVVLLSGGETTVTLRNKNGIGGRNTEFLLALALAIESIEGIHAFAADSDGIDGKGDNAGAFADWNSAARMRHAGIDPRAALARNDAATAFAAINSLFSPGPTATNINDIRAILVT